jgi:membrane-associated phospholipid phosphatase
MPPVHPVAARRPPDPPIAGGRHRRPAAALVVFFPSAVLAIATRAAAQGASAPPGALVVVHTGATADAGSAPGPAVRRQDWLALGGATAAALALMTVDARVARWSQRPTVQRPAGVRAAAGVVRSVGDPGTLAIGGVTYAVGLARRDRAIADVGLHTVGAIVVSGIATSTIKVLAGRARPPVSRDSNPHSFAFGRGLGRGNSYMSFPSGHSTAAFAFAAALSAEGRHRWPRTNRVTEPLAYTMASLTALSRIYHDRHWASDVVMGAGIGLVTGRALVRYQHARPRNAGDGRLLPRQSAQLSATPFPPTLAWTVSF